MNYEYDDHENFEVENFEVDSVCNVLKYKVDLFGYEVNIWVLLLVVAVIVGAYYYKTSSNVSVASDITLSSTSSMGSIAKQMGGFTINTPDFIRGL